MFEPIARGNSVIALPSSSHVSLIGEIAYVLPSRPPLSLSTPRSQPDRCRFSPTLTPSRTHSTSCATTAAPPAHRRSDGFVLTVSRHASQAVPKQTALLAVQVPDGATSLLAPPPSLCSRYSGFHYSATSAPGTRFTSLTTTGDFLTVELSRKGYRVRSNPPCRFHSENIC